MLSNFGANFKQARESLGLPLDKIAAETRISTRFLLAIENEEFHLLPGGIFNRGFIRAYAERVGLDPDEAVGRYERLASVSEEPLEVLRSAERASEKKSDRSLYPIAVGILVVLIGVFYFLNRNGSNTPPPAVSAPSEPAPAPAVEAAPPTPPAAETTPPAAENTPPPPPEPTPPPAPAPTPPVATTEALALQLTANGEVWVKVTADGKTAETILQPGETRSYSAQQSLDVTIGNAGGVSMKLNNRDVGPLGREGQVREFKITPENAASFRGTR